MREIFTPLRLALLGLLLLLAPRWALGPRTCVLLHDNLEVEVPWLVVLAQQGQVLAGPQAPVQPIMNGLPRAALRSGLSVTPLLFSILPESPLLAYLLHEALVRLVGLLGMYWLLRRFGGLGQPAQAGRAAAVALLWAALPAYSVYGLSVLGQPALLGAALRLRAGGGRGAWAAALVCAAFPFWSSLVLVGLFLAVAWTVALLGDWWRRGRAAGPAVRRGALGLGLLLAGYALVEWQLIGELLVHRSFVPHRVAFAPEGPGSLGAALLAAGRLWGWGQYHASAFFKGGIVLALSGALLRLRGPARAATGRVGGALLTVAAGLSLVAALAPLLTARLAERLPLLHSFQVARFYFLLALPWVLTLAVAVRQLTPNWLAYALVGLQLPFALAANPEVTDSLRALLGRPRPAAPGYAAYVALGLFGQVRQFIQARTGQPPAAYRVVCLGLPPNVAQLNGFYTLDSYQPIYPLAYKQAFRPVIAGELAKSPALARYFDAWGSRCYVFSAELGVHFQPLPGAPRVVQHLALNTSALRALGGRYLLAAVRLARPAESGLRPLGVFTDSSALWTLYLYEVEHEALAETDLPR